MLKSGCSVQILFPSFVQEIIMEKEKIKTPSQRFAEKTSGDRANPRFVRCLNPFRWLEVNEDGNVTPCCKPWFKGKLGSIRNKTMEEIWNGPAWKALREAMYEGGEWWKFCDAESCPHIQNDTWVPIDFISPETPDQLPIPGEMLESIRNGKTTLDYGPIQIGLSCDPRCNINCIMCTSKNNPDRSGELIRRALDGVHNSLPSVKRLKMLGDGEVFVVPEAREFLFNFDADRYPDTGFLIHTNGLLLDEKMWEKISHLRIDWLVISVDAATKETYEKIRRGGKWEVISHNLELAAEKNRAGRIGKFHLSMTVMRSNHTEMVEFAEMGKRLEADSTYFYPVYGEFPSEQIFHPPDISCMKRIREQLKRPIMQEKEIDYNALLYWKNWKPGVKDYARYLKKYLTG